MKSPDYIQHKHTQPSYSRRKLFKIQWIKNWKKNDLNQSEPAPSKSYFQIELKYEKVCLYYQNQRGLSIKRIFCVKLDTNYFVIYLFWYTSEMYAPYCICICMVFVACMHRWKGIKSILNRKIKTVKSLQKFLTFH